MKTGRAQTGWGRCEVHMGDPGPCRTWSLEGVWTIGKGWDPLHQKNPGPLWPNASACLSLLALPRERSQRS